MSLKSKVKTGLIWSFSDQIITQILFVVFSIFLARLLPPSSFGLVSTVTLFSNFAILFIDLGFGTALIQKKETDAKHYSSVFWFNLFAGITMYLIFYMAAPMISVFFKHPQLVLLVRVISLSFVINALATVQTNLMIKELKFKQKIIFNWVAQLVGYSIAFYLALHHFGVWAIVWMNLSSSLVNLLLIWFSTSWYPAFIFDKKKIKELSSFGLNVFGESSINYWSRNYDNFIIAKVLSSGDLGLYTRAYSLMLLPLKNISSVITKVLFPAFSKKQDDISTLKNYYLLLIKYVAFLTFPAMIGLSLVAKEFVLVFFGVDWEKMIPVLSILSLVGAIQSILFLNGMIYNSLGKAHIAFRISLLVNGILIVAFTIGVRFGIVGVAYSYLIASAILFVPIYQTALKQLNTSIKETFSVLKGIIAATTGMALVLYLSKKGIHFNNEISLLLKMLLGMLSYLILIFFLEKKWIQSLYYKLKARLKSLHLSDSKHPI